MAEIILSPLLQLIIDKLASPFLSKFHDLCRLKTNIRKLEQSLPLVQALLEDAQTRQGTDKAVQKWLLSLEDVAYESEDLLDEVMAEIYMCERRGCRGKEVTDFFLPFKPSKNLFHLASELQTKLKELHEIAREGFSFNLRENVVERPRSLGISKETWSSVNETKVYGREEDKKKLVELLLVQSKQGKSIDSVPVISIVGIGGIGKTSVAQMVYNDEKVSLHFDLKIWIYVSEVFNVRKLMISIIESATKKSCEPCGMDLLQSQLEGILLGKRFLLVLDDAWNEDQEEWERFSDLLRDGAEGSRVITTTRSRKVAMIMGSTVYSLKELSDEDCWLLFKQKAFRNGVQSESHNLLAIGKEIIKKCGGIPLAAKTLGSLLSSKKEEYWLSVQESELWNLKECQSAILPALRLSYMYLPPHLKRCFAFCSLFPKNYEINRQKMIHTWMAEGLILPDGGNRLLEDIGDEYFNDFFCLSFFQEVEKGDYFKASIYKMHDLIHDLARTIGGEEFVVLACSLPPSNLSRVRHTSIVSNLNPSSFPKDSFEARHLRTLLFLFPGDISVEIPSFLSVKFIYLRVLDLSGCGIKRLDESLSGLQCLRYLDLSSTVIQTLPDTICNLCYLQTLNLSGCSNLVDLPLGLGNVISLRHLNVTGCEGLTRMPPGIGNLVHLQTLPIYIVGKGIGQSITELHSLNLRGELKIKSMENVRDVKEAKGTNMRGKRSIQYLTFQWESSNRIKDSAPARRTNQSDCSTSSSNTEDNKDVEDIVLHLEPHSHLKRLSLRGYPGINFPRWDLPNLHLIELINCRRCKSLPPLGQLPFLERLVLQGMDGITCINDEFYGKGCKEPFPSLKQLTIKDFPYLEKWSSPAQGVPFLLLLTLILHNCPKLTSSPALPSLQHLELHHCHANITKSMENITSLSYLVINTLPEWHFSCGQFLGNNTCLERLEIRSCQTLHSLPHELRNLTALKSLVISNCSKLSDLPAGLEELKALELLEINGCHRLLFFSPEGLGGLCSLKTFCIENCTNLISLSSGLHCLTALEHLSIMACPNLIFMPDCFWNLYALRSLNIVSCPGLLSLPTSLQHVTTLQSMVIHSCPGLTDFPDWFGNFSCLRSLAVSNCKYLKSLPEELKCLSSLQHISIQDCPQLERLCMKKKGKEWEKIKHIPHIYIGSIKLGK